jgi:hypothetical protein
VEDNNKKLKTVADEAFRFLAGLNLQDHPVAEQREALSVVGKLKESLTVGHVKGPKGDSHPASTLVTTGPTGATGATGATLNAQELQQAAVMFNRLILERCGLDCWRVIVVGSHLEVIVGG